MAALSRSVTVPRRRGPRSGAAATIDLTVDEGPVAETTELRWFATGPLPADVRSWLTGSTGVAEERCDAYLVDGRPDIGIKRRNEQTLELKIRHSADPWLQLDDGLGGPTENWSKWTPADDLVDAETASRWIEVHKAIVKRRFLLDGSEVEYSPEVPDGMAGCDVEVVAVAIGDDEAWSFAFAAFGPTATRRAAVSSAWQALTERTPPPASFGALGRIASGYPEWIGARVLPARASA